MAETLERVRLEIKDVKNKIKDEKNKKRDYERRKNDINEAIRSFSIVGNYIGDVNIAINRTATNIDEGLSISGKIDNYTEVKRELEKNQNYDSKLKTSISKLKNERTSVEDKIRKFNEKIDSLNRKLKQLKAKENKLFYDKYGKN